MRLNRSHDAVRAKAEAFIPEVKQDEPETSVLLRVERAASGPSPAAKRTSGAERESIQCPEQESFFSRKPGAGQSGARLKKRLRSRRVERSVTREAEHDDVGESGRTVVAPKFGPQVNRKPTRRCAFFGAAAVLAAVTSLSLRCSSEPLPVACGAAVVALLLLPPLVVRPVAGGAAVLVGGVEAVAGTALQDRAHSSPASKRPQLG